MDHIGIKASQFSFSRLTKADPVLGVDMASTGEVGCIGTDMNDTILKAMLSVGYRIPEKAVLLSSGDTRSKVELLIPSRLLIERGLKIYATQGTHDFLKKNDIPSEILHWPDDKRQPNSLNYLRERKIDFVVNIPKNLSSDELHNDYTIRRTAIDLNIPLITNARLGNAFITAFCSLELEDISVKSMGSYFHE